MSGMKKRTVPNAPKTRREYPVDRFDYNDDVTKEAVRKVREKAAPQVEKADFELVDGLGRYAV